MVGRGVEREMGGKLVGLEGEMGGSGVDGPKAGMGRGVGVFGLASTHEEQLMVC